MCCEFHLGLKFTNKRLDCKQKCSKVINGSDKDKKNLKAKVDTG
jgi:hypothetical protein